MKYKNYDALFFKQPGNENYIMGTFVVGVSDLIEWVGIPRKQSNDTTNILFQRALDDDRLSKIKSHYKNCITPNSILITLKPESVVNLKEISDGLHTLNTPHVGQLTIKIDNSDLNLIDKIDKVISQLEYRIQIAEIDGDEQSLELDEESSTNDLLNPEDILIDVKSHFSKTVEYLISMKDLLNSAPDSLGDSEINEVKEFCDDYLKPAFLVDGQHRTFGAYHSFIDELSKGNSNYEILLPVSAIINSDWKESVFQFVIINQTAQKIDNKFLSSIISTSLTDEELETFRKQLEVSGAPVSEALILNELNSTNLIINGSNINPFFENIEHKVPNEPIDTLRYNTVKSLVNRVRNFQNGNSAVFGKPYDNFKGLTLRIGINEESWKSKHWINFMIYFWHLAKKRFTREEILNYKPFKKIDDNTSEGSNLSLKLSMQFLQDSFISFLTKSENLLKRLPDHQLKIENDTLDFASFNNIFEVWCEEHNKNYEFFECEWKGLSSFKRESEKYEAINSAFSMEQHRRNKLFRG
ncbi:hypothetical protein [Bacillus cereus]|uniref:hypothetical protein n=1 Tax=Bacillus cereus TaxID=1396 RepID=UPI0015CEF5A5|nr:hypothetical protein [Bacillus cereus]